LDPIQYRLMPGIGVDWSSTDKPASDNAMIYWVSRGSSTSCN